MHRNTAAGVPMPWQKTKRDINPEAFRIEKNKLYLFYKTRWVDTHQKWGERAEELREKADTNWQKRTPKE